MKELPKDLIDIVDRLERAYVATASKAGTPHIAVEEGVTISDGQIVFNSWFCPRTVENLRENRSVVVALWDEETGEGFQVEGLVDELEEIAALDGYAPDIDQGEYPQTEYRLWVTVEIVYDFAPGPHTDNPSRKPSG